MSGCRDIPLFAGHPRLRQSLSRAVLAELPTPVSRLRGLEKHLHIQRCDIKSDGFTARPFGGNKIRKLEFLLGEALRQKRRSVLTFGAAGSNHALATALCARKTGLRAVCLLAGQPNAGYVRRNLLAHLGAGSELHGYANPAALKRGALVQSLLESLRTGRLPMIIPPGGSTALGACGFVNAGLELKRQIDEGLLPEPDRIYVALGTMGTAAGLLLGLQAAGLDSELAAVRVVPETMANARAFQRLYLKTRTLLRQKDPSFRLAEHGMKRLTIRNEFFGMEYARFTEAGMEAVRLAFSLDGVHLDGTYTGKAMAALISDARNGDLKDKNVLFWNTLNARGPEAITGHRDFRKLPEYFHRYFEEDVQPLDRPAEAADSR